MENNVINFNENYNNKLNCKFFTTVRLLNYEKYKTGWAYNIWLKGNFYRTVQCVEIRVIDYSNFDRFLMMLDLGLTLAESKAKLIELYPILLKEPNTPLMLIMVTTI